MSIIPTSHSDLFDLPGVWHVATIGPSGEPHVSPVWANFDGTHNLFPHLEGRQKWRNLQADDRIALSATDPDSNERYLEVRGRVVAFECEGALELLDAQSQKYRGNDFPREDAQPLDKRISVVVEPLHCTTMG